MTLGFHSPHLARNLKHLFHRLIPTDHRCFSFLLCLNMSSEANQTQDPENTAATAAETKPVPPLPAGEQEEPSSPKTNSATRRLSVLYNKAKKTIATAAEKAAEHNKRTSESNEAAAEASETPAAAPAEAAAAAEHPTDKTEKRKSRVILENIFNRGKVSN